MNKKIDIESERVQVDNFIITACITLIAAFMVMITIKKPENDFLSYGYLISLGGLTVSLLCSLWHKYRFPKRLELVERESSKIIHETSSQLSDFHENILTPYKTQKIQELKANNQNLTPDQLAKEVNKQLREHAGGIIMTYLEKFQYDLDDKKKKILFEPLNEPQATMKLRIDRISQFLRYIGFVIGILFFFISIFLTLKP